MGSTNNTPGSTTGNAQDADDTTGDDTQAPAQQTARRLTVTRPATRRNPNPDDRVDAGRIPRSLQCTMNDRGSAHAAVCRTDPTALTPAQMAAIADQARLPCPPGTVDFAHRDEDPSFAPPALIYNAVPLQKGLLEETHQAINIPNTYVQAMESRQAKEWQTAINKEKQSLRKHNVFKRVPLNSVPKGEKILPLKYIFKQKADGRFKARAVVGGHLQEAGYDYGRTFAPVCRIGSVRMLLAIACEHGWPVYQMDVVVAFLNAYCDTDVYVANLPGEETKNATGETMVNKLERSLYGLSQSPSLWNDTLDESLTIFGWKRTQSDPCVYTYGTGPKLTILEVYVDDILISGADQDIVAQKKKELTDRFEMTDMGEVSRVLGIEVKRDYEEGTLAISQGPYVSTILERFGMQEANPVSTPGYGAELSMDQPEDQLLGTADKKLFQQITGSLLYLSQCSRFDLSYAVHQLTRACSNPAQVHMTAAKHVLRYLRGTPDLPIVYKQERFRLIGYTDASFGANPDNGKSTTGYLFFLGGALISFGSKTQSLTAQSTVESELQALSYGAKEAVYLSNFMTELGFKDFSSVPINSDSTGALNVAGNAMFSSRTKHIALRFFFIRELIKRKQITLHHKPSAEQLADCCTKHLPKHQFASILQQINNFEC